MAESKQPREALERFVKASAAFDAAKNEYAFAISDLRRWAGADVIDYPVLIGDVIVDTARKDGDPPFVVRPVYPVPADLPDRDEPFIVYDRQRERWVAARHQTPLPTAAPASGSPRSLLCGVVKSSSSAGLSVKSSPTYRKVTDLSGRTRNSAGFAMPFSAAFSTPHGSITAASGSLRIGKGSSSLSTMARFCSTESTQMAATCRPARSKLSQLRAYEANCPLQYGHQSPR